MPLLNYTTKIEVEKTISEIHRMLSSHGVVKIMTDYESGVISSLSFGISVNDNVVGFRLPCDWRPVLEVMKKDKKVPRRMCDQVQAVRVAWRIVKDWVEAQMAMVDTRMVRTEEVFLPYAFDGKRTLYEKMAETGFRLEGGK